MTFIFTVHNNNYQHKGDETKESREYESEVLETFHYSLQKESLFFFLCINIIWSGVIPPFLFYVYLYYVKDVIGTSDFGIPFPTKLCIVTF